MPSPKPLRRMLAALGRPTPPPGQRERLQQTVRAEVRARYGEPSPGRSPRQRPLPRAAIACGTVLLLAGTAYAGARFITNSDSTVPLAPVARAGLTESPHLQGAPWLQQRTGAPHLSEAPRLGSLRYPPGTTYRAALTQLMRSVAEQGTIPIVAQPAPPLRAGIVWQEGRGRNGPRLSLTAPFGYALPNGLVRLPSLRVSGRVPLAQARRITRALREGVPLGKGRAAGLAVDAPRLAHCQIATPGTARPPCRIQPPRRSEAPVAR